ncbi:alginate lyase family protein [Pedobacter nutrimenti]|uniref:Alginate lyase n=1 Tax=Pedobacter nutrimenti TaxID=1241337 RepID=A0A318U8M3_9SPHI|nr:alginate lyase family protein [Pedobacter nutrimenti]PYF70630.1 alginate lyase [Pedobacter nutrimenti]
MINLNRILIPGTAFILISLLFTARLKAQYVGLNKDELTKLALLVKTDPEAKKIYTPLEVLAEAALRQTPNPVDTITSEGHLANDPKKIVTIKALADVRKIYALAYVYRISQQALYLKKCIAYLLAWAQVNKSTGNPINDTKLDPLLEGYDLIKEDMSRQDRDRINTWLVQIADAQISNPRFLSAKKSVNNNWNSHRIKIVANIAYILDHKAYQKFIDSAIKSQVLKNLYPNGSGFDFEERDALHYHIYTLEPLLRAAMTIQRTGKGDYFHYKSPSGSSIQNSVNFLLPYVTGEKIHREFVNSKVSFDKKRADNKEATYKIGAAFKPASALDVYIYASYFDPAYSFIIKKLLDSKDYYAEWELLLNAVKT